ncbi:MAG: DUF6660 family protein [Ginsengibacter sp.]
MKIFALLFSLYILALALVPCCAVADCQDEAPISQKADSRQHNDACQNCSPFNQCGNCVGFTLTGSDIPMDRSVHAAALTFFHSAQHYSAKFISSFWQPPRLV